FVVLMAALTTWITSLIGKGSESNPVASAPLQSEEAAEPTLATTPPVMLPMASAIEVPTGRVVNEAVDDNRETAWTGTDTGVGLVVTSENSAQLRDVLISHQGSSGAEVVIYGANADDFTAAQFNAEELTQLGEGTLSRGRTALDLEEDPVQYNTPLIEKQEILQQLDVDRLYIITFNKDLAALPPQAFIDHFIIGLNVKHLVAGFDYTYGHKGQGNIDKIESQTRNVFTYTTIDKLEAGNEKISSTRIRKLLETGKIKTVNDLLGRPFTTYGMVVDGDKRGKAIGYPTANLQVSPDALLPKTGIYAVRVLYKNEVYEGMANLGTNPTYTYDLKQPRVEVNIFDYNNDLYGEELQIKWYKFIRDEEKFNQIDALIQQIADDEKNIRKYFSET